MSSSRNSRNIRTLQMLDLLCWAFIRSHIRFQILIKRQPTTFKVKVNWVYKIMDLLAFALPTFSGQERLEVLIDSWTRVSSQKSLWHIVTFSALLRLRQFRQSTKFRENVKIQIKSVLQQHEITQYVEVVNFLLTCIPDKCRRRGRRRQCKFFWPV